MLASLWTMRKATRSGVRYALLRKALGEGGGQQFIETVPKLGYHFVAPVRALEVCVEGGAAEGARPPRRSEALAAEDGARDRPTARDEQLTTGRLLSDPAPPLPESHARPLSESRAAREAEARRLLSEIKAQSGSEGAYPELLFDIALVYVTLGEKDEAFVWLDRTVESGRARIFDLRYSLLDALKADPRYEQMLRRHGYAEPMVAELSKWSLPER